MPKKNLSSIKQIMLLIACMMLSGMVCHAVIRELTIPRIGDRLTVSGLSGQPKWLDTLSLCPDLSSVSKTESQKLNVWAPVKSDSSAYCYLIRGRATSSLINCGDTLFCRDVKSYGQNRSFKTYPVFGIPRDSVFDSFVVSNGKTENIGPFSTVGQRHTTITDGLTALSAEAEPLCDVVCVSSAIYDTLEYGDGDKYLYRGMTKEWYAPGYRYPILENESGTLVSLAGDTIDVVDSWYSIDTAEQEEQLKDDSVNELIRQNYREKLRDRDSRPESRTKNKNGNSGSGVYYDENEDLLKIHAGATFNGEAAKEYVLCDVSGIVYASGSVDSQQISISTARMHQGTYIVYISTDSEPIVYKFKITRS